MNFKKSKNVEGSIRIVDVKTTICLMLIATLISTLSLNAQTVPEPPTPPQTPSTKTSTKKSHSIEIENDNDQKHNSSVSVSISDDEYKFRARYHQSKNEGVKAILIDHLGNNNLKVSGSTYRWTDGKNSDDVFECKLTNGHLRIYLDTDIASESFTEKIKTLGKDLKHFISGTDVKKEVNKAQRELERAERELAIAKREAAKAVRQAKRAARY